MARLGHNDVDIARACAVCKATAHKYASAVRPKPDYKIYLTEKQLRITAMLADAAVQVRCDKCLILVLGFHFVPVTRCYRCGGNISVPFRRAG